MSFEIALMVEAQEGLTWDRWRGLAEWQRLGMSRVMLQMLDMDDLDAMRFVAREVVPAFS